MKKKIALENQVSLFLVDALTYQEVIKDILNKLKKKKGIYVALNKPFKTLISLYNQTNLFYFDTVAKGQKDSHVEYIASQDLSGMSIKIKKKIKDFDFVIFDTIDALLTYNKKESVERFLTNLIGYIRNYNKKVILIGIKAELVKHDLIDSMERISDGVVNLAKSDNFEKTFMKL